MIKFTLQEGSDYIELIKLIKLLNLATSGAEAKQMVDDGIVKRNGEIEYRKRAKIRTGDKIELLDEIIQIN